MAKLMYSGGSLWSPLQSDPATTLVFIQTDRKMYAEKEEGEFDITCKSFMYISCKISSMVFFCFSKTTDSCTPAKLKAIHWTVQRGNNCTCSLYLLISIFLTYIIFYKGMKVRLKPFFPRMVKIRQYSNG